MEMAQAGIVAESRNAYEAMMLEVNQPTEKIATELVVAHSIGDILGNSGEIPECYVFPIHLRIRSYPNDSRPRRLREQAIDKQREVSPLLWSGISPSNFHT
jgi:hypothetical protein